MPIEWELYEHGGLMPGEACMEVNRKELDKEERRVADACETAYRRGFHQAIGMLRYALEDRGTGVCMDDIVRLQEVARAMRSSTKAQPWFGDQALRRAGIVRPKKEKS
jgi:hypothetical protein